MADWISFLLKWVLSWFYFGSVIVINNESSEPLTLQFVSSTVYIDGFGDPAWHYLEDGWQIRPEKAEIWGIDPGRRKTFMHPRRKCLILLGTEVNFTHTLLEHDVVLGDCFASLHKPQSLFVARFITVNQDFKVDTTLKRGLVDMFKINMSQMLNYLGGEENALSEEIIAKLVLPDESDIVIGPSLEPIQDEQDQQKKNPIFGFGLINLMLDLLNEISILVELLYVNDAFQRTIGVYLFVQLQLWNRYMGYSSATKQISYGENGVQLGSNYVACEVFFIVTLPKALQALIVLIVLRPTSGTQLASVALSFMNLIAFVMAFCTLVAGIIVTDCKLGRIEDKYIFIRTFICCFCCIKLPLWVLVSYQYYFGKRNSVVYIISSLLFLFCQSFQSQLSVTFGALLDQITIIRFIVTLKNLLISTIDFIYWFLFIWLIKFFTKCMFKYNIECFLICMTILLAVVHYKLTFA